MRAFLLAFFINAFVIGTGNTLLAQSMITDSIICRALVEADVETIKAQLKANNDTFGLPYLQGLISSLYGQPEAAIQSFHQASTDSLSPYRTLARGELLNVLANSGQYQQYCQFADQIHWQPDRYDDARLFASYPATEFSFQSSWFRLPFRLRRKSYVILRIWVNGRPARFVLDTGCTQTVITDRLAKAVGLTVTQTKTSVWTATNQVVSGSAVVDSVRLGSLVVRHLPVKSFPRINGFITSLLTGYIDGLIGLDLLKHLRYTIHFRKRYCLFEKPAIESGNQIRNLFAGTAALLCQSAPDHKPLYFFYDSGSNDFTLTRFARNNARGYSIRSVRHRTEGINGSRLTERTDQIRNFEFYSGPHRLKIPKVNFTKREYGILNVPVAAFMGNKPFHKGVLCIDFPNGQFTYSD